MRTGKGPAGLGWVMKVVVLASLVGMSICWSIMGVSSPVMILICCWAFNTIARNPQHDKANRHHVGLEPRPPDRHCVGLATSPWLPILNLQRSVPDDPDQQSVFRRDRPPDERRRRRRPGGQARGRFR